jgi:hypothetical protein
MYCPKCSQQQLSGEQRFCSRCGLPLAGVELLLANDGLIPFPPQQHSGRRRQIMKESALLTSACWLTTFLAMTMWNKGGVVETFARVGSVIFFLVGLVGLLRFLYAFVFVKDESTVDPQAFVPGGRHAVLTPPQQSPLSDYPLRPNTREMVSRGSVTEHTTRLLDE